ncbi:MAG: DsbA family oxidoreductase [Myxococcaceae bacterium]
MSLPRKPLSVVLYQDVLCAWSYLADARLAPLREELRHLVSFRTRSFALRPREKQPTQRELESWAQEIRNAAKEPEGSRLVTGLWTEGDPPRSSVPALAALEAARLQGKGSRLRLARAMQRAALEQGVNVSRSDVVLELASRQGLNMNRFTAAFFSPETRRLIVEEHRLASSRGVTGVPTLVLGGRWMLSGLRQTAEYREHILACLAKAGSSAFGAPERTLH